MKEEWKDIEDGWVGYQVSNYGRVRSLDRTIAGLHGPEFAKGKVLHLSNSRAYRNVMLTNGKRRKTTLVHRLVAQAFIENPHNKPCVNHIDGNPSNNHITNLEWCTYSENEKHSWDKLGKKTNSGCFKPGQKSHNQKQVNQYTLNGIFIKSFKSAAEAGRILGIFSGTIRDNCNGKTIRAGNFHFSYGEFNPRKSKRGAHLSEYNRKRKFKYEGEVIFMGRRRKKIVVA